MVYPYKISSRSPHPKNSAKLKTETGPCGKTPADATRSSTDTITMEQGEKDLSADEDGRCFGLADDGVQRDATSPSSVSNTSPVCSSTATKGAGSVAAAVEAEAGKEERVKGPKEEASPAAAPTKEEVDGSSAASVMSAEKQAAFADDSVGGAPQEGEGELVRVEIASSLKRSSEETASESRSDDLRKVIAFRFSLPWWHAWCVTPNNEKQSVR